MFYECFIKLEFKAFGGFAKILKQIEVEDSQVFDFAAFYIVLFNNTRPCY